jgi:type VI secretion system secreted protein Hcp
MRRAWLLVLAIATGLGVGLLATSSASAAQDIYLKLDGIPGDSQSQAAEGQIDVSSFSFGVTNPASGPGKGASRPTFSDLQVSKRVDSASPQLLAAAASGRTIPTGVLTVVSAGEGTRTNYSLCLSGLRVTSDQTGGSDTLQETVGFAYGSIVEIVHSFDAQGRPLGAMAGGWDLIHNLQFGDSSSC